MQSHPTSHLPLAGTGARLHAGAPGGEGGAASRRIRGGGLGTAATRRGGDGVAGRLSGVSRSTGVPASRPPRPTAPPRTRRAPLGRCWWQLWGLAASLEGRGLRSGAALLGVVACGRGEGVVWGPRVVGCPGNPSTLAPGGVAPRCLHAACWEHAHGGPSHGATGRKKAQRWGWGGGGVKAVVWAVSAPENNEPPPTPPPPPCCFQTLVHRRLYDTGGRYHRPASPAGCVGTPRIWRWCCRVATA